MSDVCYHCGEPVTPAESAAAAAAHLSPHMHSECSVRLSVGSVGHLMGWCGCKSLYPTMEDPPRVSKRRAAQLAAALNYALHTKEPFFCCPTCGVVSFSPGDRDHAYCGNCHGWKSPAMMAGKFSRN